MRTFDAYPFLLPGMVVSVEAVLLSAFVLMKQNRMSQRVDQRDHLNLQLDLLARKRLQRCLGSSAQFVSASGLIQPSVTQMQKRWRKLSAPEACRRASGKISERTRSLRRACNPLPDSFACLDQRFVLLWSSNRNPQRIWNAPGHQAANDAAFILNSSCEFSRIL